MRNNERRKVVTNAHMNFSQSKTGSFLCVMGVVVMGWGVIPPSQKELSTPS